MIGSTRTLRVWAYPAPADLRKGFDGLCGLVTRLRQDPLAGDCFLFVNRLRERVTLCLPEQAELILRHRALQPEQEPIVDETRLVHAIRIDDEGATKAQRSMRWCQSRPLRARRDASSQTHFRQFSQMR